jgi:hypothetical protein
LPQGIGDDQQEPHTIIKHQTVVVYREFQFGTFLVITLSLTEILMAWLFVNDIGTTPMGLGGFLVISAAITSGLLLFYGMTTVIEHGKIVLSFGIGLICRTIDMSIVQQVDIVKSPWYYGWGIRYIPNGMLYNVSGSAGVELKVVPGDKVIRIGTKDPEQLHAALASIIRARNQN